MIKIHQNISIDYISKLYEYIEVAPAVGKLDILLPSKINAMDFSVDFSLLQFISSWVRKGYSGDLYFPVEEKEVDNYFNQDFVYPTVVMCWEKNIYDKNNLDLKGILKKLSQDYFKRMEYLEHKSKNWNSIPLYSFDHDTVKRGLSRYFYNPNGKLISEENLDFNFYPVFEKIGEFYSRSFFKKSISPVINDFLKIIHELYMNTDQHAKTDENGYNLYPNIRAVNINFHKRLLKTYISGNIHRSGLVNFLKSNIPLNDTSQVYLFEISVLDSGPGFVKRYTDIKKLENISIANEVEIIKECLYKHNTSSKTIDREVKGLGLNRVLETLNHKGLLRIKTGRVDVFRDLRNNPFKGSDSPSDIQLLDWKSNSNKFTVNEICEGALLSIIYPLENEI